MDSSISNSRIKLLLAEYRGETNHFVPDNTDLISIFQHNDNRIRDFFLIISFGVISKYISVKLTEEITTEIGSFKKHFQYNHFIQKFPEIELLFLLNENGKELPIQNTEVDNLFEQFLIQDRSFRNNESVKIFLNFITNPKASDVATYEDVVSVIAEIKDENGTEQSHLQKTWINPDAFQVLNGFTQLNDFMSGLRIFFRNYEEDFPIAFCWLFYEELFDKLRRHLAIMEQFYKIVANWTFDGLILQPQLSSIEIEELWAEMEVYLKRSEDTFYWLIGIDKIASRDLIKNVYQNIYA